MQRLLHLLHVSLAGHRAQPLTRLLDWQRHPEAVSELEQHDFPLDAENDSPLTGYHPARPMPAIHDGNPDGQPHAPGYPPQPHQPDQPLAKDMGGALEALTE